MLNTFYRERYIEHPKYNPPERFEHWKKHVVGEFIPELGSDGHTVKIIEQRTPSVFFEIIAEGTRNNPSFTIAFGSGDENGLLAFKLAEMISQGMLEVYKG